MPEWQGISNRILKGTAERTSGDMSERIAKKIARKKSQKICQEECQQICQKEFQKIRGDRYARRYANENGRGYSPTLLPITPSKHLFLNTCPSKILNYLSQQFQPMPQNGKRIGNKEWQNFLNVPLAQTKKRHGPSPQLSQHEFVSVVPNSNWWDIVWRCGTDCRKLGENSSCRKNLRFFFAHHQQSEFFSGVTFWWCLVWILGQWRTSRNFFPFFLHCRASMGQGMVGQPPRNAKTKESETGITCRSFPPAIKSKTQKQTETKTDKNTNRWRTSRKGCCRLKDVQALSEPTGKLLVCYGAVQNFCWLWKDSWAGKKCFGAAREKMLGDLAASCAETCCAHFKQERLSQNFCAWPRLKRLLERWFPNLCCCKLWGGVPGSCGKCFCKWSWCFGTWHWESSWRRQGGGCQVR